MTTNKQVLKFYADSCGPCKMLSKSLDSMYPLPIRVSEVDIETSPEIAQKYGIRGVPTMILLEDGEEIGRMVGYQGDRAVKDFLGVN